MRLVLLAAVAAASVVALPAAAQTRPEVSASVGYTRFVDSESDFDVGTITGRATARFNRYFGVEAEYGAGFNEANIGGIDFKVKHDMAGYLVGYYPLSENFDLIARVGYGQTELEASSGGLSVSDTLEGAKLGIGGQYFFDKSNGVRGDVTRHEYQDNSGAFDAVSVMYVHRF